MRPCTCPQVEEEDRTTIAQVIQDAYALYSVVTIYIHATMYMPTGGGGGPNDDRPSHTGCICTVQCCNHIHTCNHVHAHRWRRRTERRSPKQAASGRWSRCCRTPQARRHVTCGLVHVDNHGRVDMHICVHIYAHTYAHTYTYMYTPQARRRSSTPRLPSRPSRAITRRTRSQSRGRGRLSLSSLFWAVTRPTPRSMLSAASSLSLPTTRAHVTQSSSGSSPYLTFATPPLR